MPGKIHVLGDTLSRALHATIHDDHLVNDIDVPYIQFEDVINRYEDYQFFGPIVKALNEEWPNDPKQKLKLEKMLPMFEYKDKRLKHYGKICVPRKCVSKILGLLMIRSLVVISS